MAVSDEVFIRRTLRWAILAVGVAGAALALLWLLKGVLTYLAVAFAVAYLLDPIIDRFEERGVPRRLAILLLLLATGAGLAAFLAFIVPSIQREVTLLSERLPAYSEALAQHFLPWIEDTLGVQMPASVEEGVRRLREQGVSVPIASVQDFFGRVLGLVTGTVGAILGLLVVPLFAYYLLAEFDRINARLVEYVPPRQRPYVLAKARQADALIAGFLRGQLTVCALLGVLYAVGFQIIGIPLAILIGLAAGVLAIIPYLGNVVALGTASLLALAQYGVGSELLAVVAWYVVVQTLEGYVLTPRIVGDRVGLHPMVVVLALLIAGDLLGFLGLLIAVPATAVLAVFVSELLDAYRRSPLFTGEPEAAPAAEPRAAASSEAEPAPRAEPEAGSGPAR